MLQESREAFVYSSESENDRTVLSCERHPVRVLHTLAWITRGGVEQLRLLMAEGLSKEKYQHEIICQAASSPLREKLESEGWVVHEIGLAPHVLSLSWYRKAISIAREFKPDLIHGAVFEGSALAVVLGLMQRQSRVIIEEQSDGRNRTGRGRLLMRVLSLLSDRTVGVAPEIYEYLRRDVKVPAQRLRLVNNGARQPRTALTRRERESLRADLGIEGRNLVIGSMGRLNDDHKRFSDLIQVMPNLLRNNQELKLLIIGDGEDREKLEEMSRELGVTESVIFAGFQEDVHRYLNLMDIFALVSSGEALPLALVEAMHSGLPCVATNVGGNSYVLDSGGSGILLEPGDPESLILALQTLTDSESKRIEYGQVAKIRAGQLFSPSAYLEAIEDLWQETLATSDWSGR